MRVGILPHADFPHVLPCFRIARELTRCGHGVWVLGSDVQKVGRGHSEVWGDLLATFRLAGRERVHRGSDIGFADWIVRQLKELDLDVIILDAVWQGLAYACNSSEKARRVVIHHAGLPDFRSADVPTWVGVHPGHSKDQLAQARNSIEQFERAGHGVRGLLSSVKRLSAAGRLAEDHFEFGCGEFADLPAVRAMSFCPAVEFPAERARVEYFGSLLPRPGDVDWKTVPAELANGATPLIACVFGTTGLQGAAEYQWLFTTAKKLAESFPDGQVVVVIPAAMQANCGGVLPKNLFMYPWVPLWELLVSRKGGRVLVSPPGVGAFREAIAAGTPIIAIPRKLDQFGAAARVEYFGVGSSFVQHDLPEPKLVVQRVAHVLADVGVQTRVERLRQECAAFDSTQPLKKFVECP